MLPAANHDQPPPRPPHLPNRLPLLPSPPPASQPTPPSPILIHAPYIPDSRPALPELRNTIITNDPDYDPPCPRVSALLDTGTVLETNFPFSASFRYLPSLPLPGDITIPYRDGPDPEKDDVTRPMRVSFDDTYVWVVRGDGIGETSVEGRKQGGGRVV